MSVTIVFSSPKGGCGKTTAATILATELAAKGVKVTVIDADPNKDITYWSQLPGFPEHIDIVSNVTEDTVIDDIEAAGLRSAVVVVDLEGTASLLVANAISFANFVVIPIQGSNLDAKHASQQIKLIRSQERIVRRSIPFAVLRTWTNAAIIPGSQRHVDGLLLKAGIPVFSTRLADREAYRALFRFGGTLAGLEGRAISNVGTAIANAQAYAGEIMERVSAAA